MYSFIRGGQTSLRILTGKAYTLMVGMAVFALTVLVMPTGTSAQTTNVLMVDGRLPASTGIEYLVQFSGGSKPAQLSLGGIQAQVDVLERRPDGSARVFRGFVPTRGSITSGTFSFTESSAGIPHSMSGTYPNRVSPKDLTFVLENSVGQYEASVGSATNAEVIVGPGNQKGHSGADYLQIHRYFCPFVNKAAGHPHKYCGAMIVYVTRRVDLDGYIVECLFANSHLKTPIVSYDGDKPENPGHIVYKSLSFTTGGGAVLPTIVHADTYTGNGGAGGLFLAREPNGERVRHLSAPGTAPGWMFAVVQNGTPEVRVRGMLEGRDGAIALDGRGFHPGSTYGFGPNELRHDDPELWQPADSHALMRQRVNTQVATLKGHISAGTSAGSGSDQTSTPRAGVYQGFGVLNPNGPGGVSISGHHLEQPIPEYFAYLRLGAMMATRRSNHSFYVWNGSRPLLPADAVNQYDDPTEDVVGQGAFGVTDVSYLHNGDVGDAVSNGIASTQFSSVSPYQGHIIGFRGNGNTTNPLVNEQQMNGPSTRSWNQLQPGESIGFPEEDPASFVGYSHNIGHSPRFFVAREAYLFGLSMLGYDLSNTYAAHCASHHLAFDVDPVHRDWRYSRPVRSLQAWGLRDRLGMDAGSGRMNARGRDWNGKLGTLDGSTGNANWGQRRLEYITDRILAWSMVWQFSGASIGNDSYRNATIDYPASGNPALLFAAFVVYVQTGVGVTSQSQQNLGSNPCFDDIPGNGGQTNIATREGGLPNGNPLPDGDAGEHWTATLSFHDVYFSMAVDAVAKHFPASVTYLIQPARERIFWQLIQNEANADPNNNGRIGIPYCAPVSRGMLGMPMDVTLPSNPVASEADLRNDALRWVYTNANGRSGWGAELENSSLGALVGLRNMTTPQRVEFTSLIKRQWGLLPSATTAQLFATMRASAGQYDGPLTARLAPFLAEASAYLQ